MLLEAKKSDPHQRLNRKSHPCNANSRQARNFVPHSRWHPWPRYRDGNSRALPGVPVAKILYRIHTDTDARLVLDVKNFKYSQRQTDAAGTRHKKNSGTQMRRVHD